MSSLPLDLLLLLDPTALARWVRADRALWEHHHGHAPTWERGVGARPAALFRLCPALERSVPRPYPFTSHRVRLAPGGRFAAVPGDQGGWKIVSTQRVLENRIIAELPSRVRVAADGTALATWDHERILVQGENPRTISFGIRTLANVDFWGACIRFTRNDRNAIYDENGMQLYDLAMVTCLYGTRAVMMALRNRTVWLNHRILNRSEPSLIALSPDGRRAGVLWADFVLTVVDSETGRTLWSRDYKHTSEGMQISNQGVVALTSVYGALRFITERGERRIEIWDPQQQSFDAEGRLWFLLRINVEGAPLLQLHSLFP